MRTNEEVDAAAKRDQFLRDQFALFERMNLAYVYKRKIVRHHKGQYWHIGGPGGDEW